MKRTQIRKTRKRNDKHTEHLDIIITVRLIFFTFVSFFSTALFTFFFYFSFVLRFNIAFSKYFFFFICCAVFCVVHSLHSSNTKEISYHNNSASNKIELLFVSFFEDFFFRLRNSAIFPATTIPTTLTHMLCKKKRSTK